MIENVVCNNIQSQGEYGLISFNSKKYFDLQFICTLKISETIEILVTLVAIPHSNPKHYTTHIKASSREVSEVKLTSLQRRPSQTRAHHTTVFEVDLA